MTPLIRAWLALTALGSAVAVPKRRPVLRFNERGEFSILQFADLHFANGARSPCSGGKIMRPSDRTCTDARTITNMHEAIEAKKPEFVVLSGDQIDGDFRDRDSAEDWRWSYRQVLSPMLKASVPWASIFGNHDVRGNSFVVCTPLTACPNTLYLRSQVRDPGTKLRETYTTPEKLQTRRDLIELETQHELAFTSVGPSGIGGAGNYVVDVLSSTSDEIGLSMIFMDGHGAADPLPVPITTLLDIIGRAGARALGAWLGVALVLKVSGDLCGNRTARWVLRCSAVGLLGFAAVVTLQEHQIELEKIVLKAINPGAHECWDPVAAAQISWMQAQARLPRRHSAFKILFVHTPPDQFQSACNASQNTNRRWTGNCTCCSKDSPSSDCKGTKSTRDSQYCGSNSFLVPAATAVGVSAIFSGHDHRNDFCAPWQSVLLCYGRASGWHGYGSFKFDRGVRRITVFELGRRKTLSTEKLLFTSKRTIDKQGPWPRSNVFPNCENGKHANPCPKICALHWPDGAQGSLASHGSRSGQPWR